MNNGIEQSDNIPEYVKYVYPEILPQHTIKTQLVKLGALIKDIDISALSELFFNTVSPLPQRVPRTNRRGKIELELLHKKNQHKILSTKRKCILPKCEGTLVKRFVRDTRSSKEIGTPELDRLEQRSRVANEEETQEKISRENADSCRITQKRITYSKLCISLPKKSKLTNETVTSYGKATPDNKHNIVKCKVHMNKHATAGKKLEMDKPNTLTLKRRKIIRDNFRPSEA